MSDQTPLIRTCDPLIRSQQWERFAIVTHALAQQMAIVRAQGAALVATKHLQATLWSLDAVSAKALREIAFAVKQGQQALQTHSERLIHLNSELEALHTALMDTPGDEE